MARFQEETGEEKSVLVNFWEYSAKQRIRKYNEDEQAWLKLRLNSWMKVRRLCNLPHP